MTNRFLHSSLIRISGFGIRISLLTPPPPICYLIVTCEEATHGSRLESFGGPGETEDPGSARGAGTHHRRTVGGVSQAVPVRGHEASDRAEVRRPHQHSAGRAGAVEHAQHGSAARGVQKMGREIRVDVVGCYAGY